MASLLRTLAALAAALCCASAGADDGAAPAAGGAHSLPALLQRALPRDPQVGAARAALAATEARYRQARSRLLPNAGLDANGGRSRDLDGALPIDRRTEQVEASLRWNLYNGGADLAEMQASARDVAAAEAELRRAREEGAERLAEAYFDVQRLDRTLERNAARLADVALLVSQVRRQAEAGKASELDLQQALSSQLDAEIVEDGLQAERAAAAIKLAVLASEAVAELPPFAFAPADGAFDGGGPLGAHAPVRAAQERAAAARLRVPSLASTLTPKIDLDARRLLNNNTTPPASTVQQHGWSLGIRWDIPLGGEIQARRSESASRADVADADLARAEQSARADRDSLVPRIASAERSLALLESQEEKLAQLVRGSAIQFEAGRRNLQQIIQTRDNYFGVQQRRIDQAHRLALARMRQLALSGQLLDAFGLPR